MMKQESGFIDIFFGDGGKGNVISVFLAKAARRVEVPVTGEGKPVLVYNGIGGNNAANTYSIRGEETVLRQLPGGLLIPEKTFSQMGQEKYIRPTHLMKEIKAVQSRGMVVSRENLGIAPNAHMTFSYHVNPDLKNLRTEGEHATTGQGILQTAADKYERTGLRFIEFLDEKLMANVLYKKHFQEDRSQAKRIASEYGPEREFLGKFVKQDHVAFTEHGHEFKFATNAHGVGLDINSGLYPGITSSHVTKLPRWAKVVFGVCKMYVSSVGHRDRAFVTQIQDKKLESILREEWGEKGTGTGLNRGLGWFDAVLGRYSVQVAGIQHLAATCADRMTAFYKLGVKPKIAVAYEINGKKYEGWESTFHRRDTLRGAKAIYVEFDPWEHFTEKDGQTLTQNAEAYTNRIERELGKKFVMYTQGKRGEQDAVTLVDLLAL